MIKPYPSGTVSPNKSFLLQVALVTVFGHGNRKTADTHPPLTSGLYHTLRHKQERTPHKTGQRKGCVACSSECRRPAGESPSNRHNLTWPEKNLDCLPCPVSCRLDEDGLWACLTIY